MSLKAKSFQIPSKRDSTEMPSPNDSFEVCFFTMRCFPQFDSDVSLSTSSIVSCFRDSHIDLHGQGSYHHGRCRLLLLLLCLFLTQEHLQFFTLISAFGNDCGSIHDYGQLRKSGFSVTGQLIKRPGFVPSWQTVRISASKMVSVKIRNKSHFAQTNLGLPVSNKFTR